MSVAKQEFLDKILTDGNLSESFVEALIPQVDTIFSEIQEDRRPQLLDLVEELVEHQRQNEIALRPFMRNKDSRRQRPVVQQGAEEAKEDKSKVAI